ncbi:MAG: helix-turn-helix domain-containing protein [Prochloraceae cyanobacterium]|nr:helix-turn-helix domain-containing protein [Prochloraceae cyanobacterium]
MILNYTYRIYPDAKQVDLLNEWLERGSHVSKYSVEK